MARAVGRVLITLWIYLTVLYQTQTQIESWFELLFLFKPRAEPTLFLWRLHRIQKHPNWQSKNFLCSWTRTQLHKNYWFEPVTNLLPWWFQSPVIHHVMLAKVIRKSTSICVKMNDFWKLKRLWHKWLLCGNLLWNFMVSCSQSSI